MLKKHMLYLLFQIKSSIRVVPRLLLCTVIVTAVVTVAGICGNTMLNSGDRAVNAKIAVVLPEDDPTILLAFQIVAKMDSISSIASFVPTKEETAIQYLEEGKVAAAVILPDNFILDIITGKNTPARIIIPKNAGIESLLFCTTIDAGSRSVALAQTSVYAVADLYEKYGISDEDYEIANEYLNNQNISYALRRAGFYNTIVTSATGTSSSAGYYIASGFVLMLLLCSLSVIGAFSNNPPAIMESLKINRISKGYIRISEFISVGLIFCLLFGGTALIASLTFAKSIIHMNFTGFLCLLLLIFSVISYIMLICCMTDSGLISTLLIFLTSVAMLYACGRILPSVYLPQTVATVGEYLPVRHWCRLFESLSTGRVEMYSLLYTIFSVIAFVAASIGITAIRGRDE